MKVLLVTNMYPTPETPYYGIFVKAIKRYPTLFFSLMEENPKRNI